MFNKNNYNIRNLIFDAEFETKLCNDLYWVPLNCLGKTHRSNTSFQEFNQCNLTYVQSNINCVYEAVQYLNYIGFSEKPDVKFSDKNDINWVYHSSGIEAIKNMYGICTSVASAVKFLCKKIYQYIGYILLVRPDTSYHILCYIRQNGMYFIFDPSAYVYGSVEDIIFETGNKADMYGKLFTSICFKTSDLTNFIKYYQRILIYNNHYFVFVDLFDKENCIEKMAIEKKKEKISVFFPSDFKFSVINKNEDFFSVKRYI